ncbi:unnamed protein product [Spirodela intermedia]|uniref:TRUD domain-containing protein n=1 Tax=Spirodela intermedia TaxID=51605 RepID=A0A7I8IKW3_SPIIN|nr:unnamed protein product [Spirodela intermedia]CAA6658521.1 unnamed protein product [Spirodela intermedia]
MAKPLEESEVGISCYVSPLPGFRGILKHRYADFIVNEVDCDGNVIRLTSFDVPEEGVEAVEEEEQHPDDSDYGDKIQMFRSITGEEDAELLRGLLARISSGEAHDDAFIVLSPDADKVHRTEVHNFFKKNMRSLITDVVEVTPGDAKCVRVRFSGGGRGDMGRSGKKRKAMDDKCSKEDKRFDSRGSKGWPEHLGKFLRFHLYKENKDTQEALGVIGKMLGIQQKSFGFAGTKDKRAVTTQRVTVFKQYAKKLASLNNRLIGIKVGDFCHVQEGLVLGKLLGNRFTIVLRGVVADSDDTIKAAADALGRKGFINYFGLQRFGSGSVPTHLVGAALLRGEWKAAVGLILDPRDGDILAFFLPVEIREAREYYKESGDVEATLRQLPRYLVAERAILQCLKKCPGNYLQALKAIPRTLRMMYVHSYQSYLWNHAASMRVKKYGVDEVVLGDLVYCKGSSGGPSKPGFVEVQDIDCTDVNDDDEEDDPPIPTEKAPPVKAIDDADLAEGGYTLEDVILPLPGSRMLYPENDIASLYHELADKDSIKLTETVHAAKEFSITSMKGGYRRVFQCPSDFTWELLSYTHDDMPLVETDVDILSKSAASAEKTDESSDGSSASCSQAAAPLEEERGPLAVEAPPPRVALKLGFTLPASCYATMAIRELLKSSTSAAFHKTLNS